MKSKLVLSKYIIPVASSVAILLIVLYQLSHQSIVRKGGDSSLYRNLMECQAYVRKGFNLNELLQVPEVNPVSGDWVRFDAKPLRIKDSPLSDLPQRRFLSPFGEPAQEFTIIIPVEMDKINSSLTPGLYLGYIGQNWEIFLNGVLVRSEIHLDENGQIKSSRNWRGVHFPLEKNLFVEGTNILAFRIIGDPTLGVTGFYYSEPYYIDEYKEIELSHNNLLLVFLSGIFGYTGLHYFLFFLFFRKKEQIFYLYYSIFSFLLCIYSLTWNSNINTFIPNSDISIRLEFASLFLMVPFLSLFVEQMGRQKRTLISRLYMAFSLFLALTQAVFCTQYGAEILMIWSVTVLVYLSYVFVYDIFYYYFWERPKNDQEGDSDTFISIMVGSVLVYICGIYDVIDTLFIHSSLRLFLYSIFVFNVGMAITLSKRFRGIYIRLQQNTQTVTNMKDALLNTMAVMVEYRDDITGGHIERTKQWVKIIIEEMYKSGIYLEEIKDIDVNLLFQSSQLHDIGKITIADNILKKPGKLDEEEFEDMKKHAIHGEHIIIESERHTKETEFLKYARIFAVSHHEKWDGTGYPHGLKGNDIPLLGRIMAIADVYDALISVRPYKHAYSHEEAVHIINESAGSQFDPLLVDVFNRVSDRFKECV